MRPCPRARTPRSYLSPARQLHVCEGAQSSEQHWLGSPQAAPDGLQHAPRDGLHAPLQHSAFVRQEKFTSEHVHCPTRQAPLQHAKLLPSGEHVAPARRHPQCPDASHTPLQQSVFPLQEAPLPRHVHCPTWQDPLQQAAPAPSGQAAPGDRQPQCPDASQNPLQQSVLAVQAEPVWKQHTAVAGLPGVVLHTPQH